MVIARAVAAVSIRSAPVRGMFLFGVASLARSRRHALVLATYLGLAIAISLVGLISSSYFNQLIIDRPVAYVLALPMVFMFFAVFGLSGLRDYNEWHATGHFAVTTNCGRR